MNDNITLPYSVAMQALLALWGADQIDKDAIAALTAALAQQAEPDRWVIEKVGDKLMLNGKEIDPGTIELRLDGLTYRSSEKVEVRQQAEPVAEQSFDIPTGKQSLQVPTIKDSLTVWVISEGKAGGQFSWDQQDERFWTRMTPALEQQGLGLKAAHGWAAPKDRYAVPVLFNPYTGGPRDVRDVQSDPTGILIVPLGKVFPAAAKEQQAEPVAVHQWREQGCSDWYDGHPDFGDGGWPYETRTLYTAPPQQQAEPVPAGLTLAVIGNKHFGNPIPPQWYAAAKELISSTAQPQHKPLTDAQLDGIAVVARRGNLHDLRIAIEAKLKQTNNT